MSQNNHFICSEQLCTGCGLCISKCPQNAIKWYIENDKRKVAIIDPQNCINCNLCNKICPQNKDFQGHLATETYACWLKDKKKLKKSSSGGIASALSEQWIEEGGIVFGAAWNGDKVEHIVVSQIEELDRLSGSKYVQSETESTFKELSKYLKSGNNVLFIGTPCQVAAAKQCCSKANGKLVTVDLICHGVPPFEYLQDYLNENKIFNIKNLTCRSRNTENYYCIKIQDNNNKEHIIPREQSQYIYAFLEGIILRENCYNCKFACPERISDITIGDFWNVNRSQLPINAPDLLSTVTIHTKEGEILWENIKSKIQYHKRSFKEAIEGNDNLKYPSKINPYRKFFIENYNNNFSKTIDRIKNNKNILETIHDFSKQYLKRLVIKIISLFNKGNDEEEGNIGIITLPLMWLLSNYGSLFQHYALREILKQLGYKPFRYEYTYTIKNEYVYFVTNKLRKLFNVLVKNFINPCNLINNFYVTYKKTKIDFSFRDFFITYFGAVVEKSNHECKQYIVGSDQIWTDPNNFTTLNIFKDNVKKIAYAASADWEYIKKDLNWTYYMSEVLPNFDYISLREDSGVKIINNILKDNKAIKTVDPVLLLKKENYLKLIDDKKYFKNKTIFCYFLNISNNDQLNINVLENLANQLNCNLRIAGIQGAEKYIPHKYIIYLSPLDYLRCYRDATYIITNSFHGTVFSLIFNKSFLTLEQFEKSDHKQNERIINLLKTYNLLNRFISQNEKDDMLKVMNDYICWESVNANINKNRDFSLHWLKESLIN